MVPPARRLLDVGCSEGHFGEIIARRGTEVWGIEPRPDAAEVARARLSMVITGHFPTDLPSDETFDCIVFNDVLEHMPDPAPALHAAKRHLNPGGCIVASVPNIRHIGPVAALVLHGRWDYQDWGILDRTHVRFFTKATMRELLEENGFEVIRQEPNSWTGLTGKWRVLRLLGRLAEEFEAVQYLMVGKPTSPG